MVISNATRFPLPPGWKVIFRDLDINAGHILRRAGLAEDLFSQEKPMLKASEYFRFWNTLMQYFNNPKMPLTLVDKLSIEGFNAPIFATLCSPNLAIGLQRLSCFKRLIGPINMHVEQSIREMCISFSSASTKDPLPDSLAHTEHAFIIKLARMATREHIIPHQVECTTLPQPIDAFTHYFGVQPTLGTTNRLTFSQEDARRVFLTANNDMWGFFEPELRLRLHNLEKSASTHGRVKAALLELLPSGRSSIVDVASNMAVSKRTLQRRLSDENYTYQRILSETREELARFYLTQSDLSCSEISYLVGFEDPNSFFRAFNQWTGLPPERLRQQARGFDVAV
ncbi:AraC family transcriptional regulator [Maricurvus nonylphenolicus]|uniref:AraC family transcriptional regulator n=1 Tax=Maricurvus nonylphenolicus TaxID=1008307 RepID=UPI0036F2A479